MVKTWPFKVLSDLKLRDKKVTLNHLEDHSFSMEEIRRSPVEVGSLSHYLQGFMHPRILPSTVYEDFFWCYPLVAHPPKRLHASVENGSCSRLTFFRGCFVSDVYDFWFPAGSATQIDTEKVTRFCPPQKNEDKFQRIQQRNNALFKNLKKENMCFWCLIVFTNIR